jgi:4-aminobutyrate aminotransferase
MEIEHGRVSGVWARAGDVAVARGSGCHLFTADGQAFLDFTSGIAVVSTGHCHPHVVAAIQRQAEQLMHAQANVVRHAGLPALAGRLGSITPPGIDTFFVTNSGAEAVEAAVKLSKQATRRTNVMVFDGGFHGRTHLTMAMTTSKAVYRSGYEPLPSGILVAPSPVERSPEECLAEIDRLFATRSLPDEIAAMVVEPVLGEGGYWPMPPEFLRGLRERCTDHGILLVADEVQSGMGRTGTMFCVEQADVVPDVVVIGKGLGSGFPVAAIGAPHELMQRWPVGSHGGTYGGNPLATAAAIATIDVLVGENLLENVRERGRQLRSGLDRLAEEHTAQVRGLGLMVAIELADADRARRVIDHCREQGQLLLMTAGHAGTTIRLMPPLIVTEDQIAEAVGAIERALRATAA